MTDIPNPDFEFGQYHYRAGCKECDWYSESDKGMNGPEKEYQKHWLEKHQQIKKVNSSFSSIHPLLQTAFDATSIGEGRHCWQKYKYSIIDGHQTRDTNIHLFFGSQYAHSFEKFHHFKAQGLTHRNATEKVAEEILSSTWNHQLNRPWSSDDQYKNRDTLLRSVLWYLKKFENDDLVTVILPDGTPAVELHFDFDIGYTSRLTGEPFRLVGHLDRLARMDFILVITDQKTTKFQITEAYFARFNPDVQVSTYLVAGNHIFSGIEAGNSQPVLNMVIDAAHIKVRTTDFKRGVVSRTIGQLDEWIRNLFIFFDELERRVETNTWPQNDKACGIPHTDPKTGEVRYGCQFRDVCAADPSMRDMILETRFTRRTWDPAKPRTIDRIPS